MNVQKRNDVSIYCLSAGTTLPEWLGDRGRRNLAKRDESVRRRIELLQEFQMPASSSKLRQSADGRYIIAAGTYPPRIRCYDVHELGLKFERYLNASAIDLALLGQDYGKLALLLEDRTVAFHAHYGAHESVRIPTFGRALAYEPSTCEVLIAAKGDALFRINLEEGRFREPWSLQLTKNGTTNNSADSVSSTAISVHPRYPLTAVGCDDGTVRFWDSRTPDSHLKPFLQLDVRTPTAGYGYADEYSGYNPLEITAIAHDDDSTGLYTAVGTGGGLVALYDVRSSRPLYIQEHKAGRPIHTVKFHTGSGLVLSGDEQLIKAWRYKPQSQSQSQPFSHDPSDPNTAPSTLAPNVDDSNDDTSALGSVRVNIEGHGGKLTHFIVAGDENDPNGDRSGVLLCATDQPKMDSFYIPALGVAPKWCSFLENITEELEERDLRRHQGDATASGGGNNNDDEDTLVRNGQESVFENYKFVSRDDLETLGVAHLIGTPMLRGYMHGFFMDANLYNRVRAVANPFEYQEYQKKKLRERLEAKQSSRIAPRDAPNKKKKKVAVNPALADRLQAKAAAVSRNGSNSKGGATTTKAGLVAKGLLSDDRFGSLFSNPDFEIDEEDEEFKLRNPSGVAAAKRRQENMDSDDDDEDDEDDDIIVDADGRGDNKDAFDAPSDEEGGGDHSEDHSDALDSDSDDNDGFQGGKVRGEAYESMKALSSPRNTKQLRTTERPTKPKKKKAAILQEADDLGDTLRFVAGAGDASSSSLKASRQRRDELPLAERKVLESEALSDRPQVRISKGGAKEVSFIPRDTKRKMEQAALATSSKQRNVGDGDGGVRGRRNRRGVKELGFKTPFQNKSR